jgi:hypothetical protein
MKSFIRWTTWARYVAPKVEKRTERRVLPGKLEGKRSLVRPRCRLVHDVKINLREIGWVDME